MSGSLSLSWIEGWPALQARSAEWQDLVRRTGAEVFLSPQWLAAWWPQLGRGRRMVTLVAMDQGRMVGLLPFMLDRLWLGPWPVTLARLAGTDPNAIVLTLPVDPALQKQMLTRACQDLTGRYRAGLISFTPLSERAAYLPDLLDLAQTSPALAQLRQDQGTHSFFDLPASFATYLETMVSNKRRGQIRREISALTATFAMQNRHFVPDAAEFDDFVRLHNAQWQAVGKGGHFQDWPGSQAVYRALAGREDGLHFYAQTGADGPLSTQMCLLSGQTCHWRLPARSLDPRADKLSIGKIGLILMIEDLIAQGITRIEGGRGVYDYKTQHGGQNLVLSRLILTPDTAISRLRLKLCLALADLLDFAYYRIWFKKIAPTLRQRLGLSPRPLWRLWIKSRI